MGDELNLTARLSVEFRRNFPGLNTSIYLEDALGAKDHVEHYKKQAQWFIDQIAIFEGSNGGIGTYDTVDGKRVDTTAQHVAAMKEQRDQCLGWAKMWEDLAAKE